MKTWDLFTQFTIFSFMSAFLPVVLKWVLPLLTRRTSEEKELYQEYRNIKNQLASLSMVDEFSKYAKLQRKSIKLKESLNEAANSRTAQSLKLKIMVTYCLQFILAIMLFIMIWLYRYEPLFHMQNGWMFPLDWLLSLPTGQPGAVSASAWLLISGTSFRMLLKPLM